MTIKSLCSLKTCHAWLIAFLIIEVGCSGIAASRETPSKPTQSTAKPDQQVSKTIPRSLDRSDGMIRKISALPVDQEYCPYDFQFVTDQVGWLFCSDHIWQTTDGGQTWQRIAVANISSRDYASFFFINPQEGWCYSSDTIQRTEDGGHHWTRVPNPIQKGTGRLIYAVKFLKDGKTGWLAGSDWEPIPPGGIDYYLPDHSRTDGKNAKRGMIFYTSDGGQHWQKQSAPIKLGYLVYGFYISESNQVWTLCDYDLLHLVGNTWKKVDYTKARCPHSQLLDALGQSDDAKDSYQLTEINFANSTYGWLSVDNGLLAKTEDGGRTWCDLMLPESLREEPNERSAFVELYFADSKKGWGRTRSGKLYRTYDGGASWEKTQSDVRFSKMFFLNPQNGWLIAPEGVYKIQTE